MMFHSIEEAIADLREGKVVIVVDDEDRENEGDFVALSEGITPETINFMITHGRGLVCTSITQALADQLDLPLMTAENSDPFETAFTISVDHETTKTGISAFERARTIQALLEEDAEKTMFKRPGHVFPLIAKEGGVLTRPGHTEASVDLAMLSGAKPSGVICEIIKEDGHMARLPDLLAFGEAHQIKIISIEDLIAYRKQLRPLVKREVQTKLPTAFGEFEVIGYSNNQDEKEHIALVKGNIEHTEATLTRVHSECMTGDVFSSHRCDCGPQLEKAMALIEEKGSGVIIYMRQEGRDIGLFNKLKAYKLQDEGMDTVEANEALGFPEDAREYDVAAAILADLGITSICFLTNNPAKIKEIEAAGIKVTERVPLEAGAHPANAHYLRTKQTKMGHLMTVEGGS